MNCSIKDVARECNVSIATVSRAFNQNSIISEQTRKLILSKAEEMCYVPNIVARGLKRSKSQTIGIVIPSINNAFYIEVLKYLQIELQKRGYHLIVNFMQKDVVSEKSAIEALMYSRPETIIFFPRTRETESYINNISKNTKIIQLFSAPYNEFCSVLVDDALGVKMAVDYLINKGHSKILYVGNEADPRVKGYYEAFGSRDKKPEEELILLNKSISSDEVQKAIIKYKPTAVLAIGSLSDIAFQALVNSGLNIPKDISFIVFDDVRWARIFSITAISHPFDKIVSNIIELIFNPTIDNVSLKVEKIIIPPILVERTSVIDITGK